MQKNAELSKKIADKTAELHRYETQLTKDEESERKKLEIAQKKREKEQQDLQKKIKEEMDSQIRTLHSRMLSSKTGIHDAINDEDESPQYDVFISHASEDKDLFVRPFAEYLKSQGVKSGTTNSLSHGATVSERKSTKDLRIHVSE
ncbi:Uncharacterised protein [Klebsiella variicola]|nr:Uncharacterised protein [Klebsiella variicola]